MNDHPRAVTFVNRQGLRLFGILHEPPGTPRSDLAVILLSPGVKNRVAPHRLYNKMTTTLTGLGLRVLRFDFYGLGDSEGEIGERLLAQLYRSVGLGRYVEDTTASIDWMQSTFGVNRVVLGGLCGGALTGLLAGQDDPRVAGLLALGVPVTLEGTGAGAARFVSAGQLQSMRAGYLRKLLDPASWARLLSFKSDYRLLLRSLSGPLRRRRTATPDAAPSPSAPDPTNPHFAPAFLRMVERGACVLLVFCEADRLYWEFQETFLVRHRQAYDAHAARIDLAVVKDANHIFSFTEWQQDMLATARTWLVARFPAPVSGPAMTELAQR